MFPPSAFKRAQASAHERSDLLAPLLKAGTNQGLGDRPENDGNGLAHQVEQAGLDVRLGMEAGGGDPMAWSYVISGLQKNRYGTKGLASGLGNIAAGGFLLQHEHHSLGQRSGQHGVEPGGGNGI